MRHISKDVLISFLVGCVLFGSGSLAYAGGGVSLASPSTGQFRGSKVRILKAEIEAAEAETRAWAARAEITDKAARVLQLESKILLNALILAGQIQMGIPGSPFAFVSAQTVANLAIDINALANELSE